VPEHRFLDGANIVRDLALAPAEPGVYGRRLSSVGVLPYAFVATSG
jgi:hypothetical protein